VWVEAQEEGVGDLQVTQSVNMGTPVPDVAGRAITVIALPPNSPLTMPMWGALGDRDAVGTCAQEGLRHGEDLLRGGPGSRRARRIDAFARLAM